ncbi:hypothetical protein H5410_027014 [Solanum commersonii]|uniref:Uncharacterized protein n=1 Tax=Solanum commersonii TaxID=4109 RepID=A0A9J5YYN5_SOLCO|nr:hypothetical protein H5410_027014 [Solanum commersonii]
MGSLASQKSVGDSPKRSAIPTWTAVWTPNFPGGAGGLILGNGVENWHVGLFGELRRARRMIQWFAEVSLR